MIKKILELIKKHESISLFMHKNPDGDSISSSYGLALAILEKYPNKNIKIVADLKYLKENFKYLNWKDELFTLESNATLSIMGDGSSENRIWYYEQFAKADSKIIFDHHRNEIELKANVMWHEPNYPASALQAYEIAKEMNINFSEETSIALIVGILTDTGFFKFSGVNQKAPLYFSSLLKNISNKKINDLYNNMFIRKKEDIEIQQFIFNKLKYEGNVAYCIFEQEDIDKYTEHNIKTKVNSIGHIEGTGIWVFFIWDNENKIYKASMRSKELIISDLATKWGGGGHYKAAATKAKDITEIKKLLFELNQLKDKV